MYMLSRHRLTTAAVAMGGGGGGGGGGGLIFGATIARPAVTKRCKTLSGHNVVEGKDFKNTA